MLFLDLVHKVIKLITYYKFNFINSTFIVFLSSKIKIAEYIDVIQNGLPVIKWNEMVQDDVDKDSFKVGLLRDIHFIIKHRLFLCYVG